MRDMVKEVQLSVEQYAASMAICMPFLRNCQFDVASHYGEQLVVTLAARIATQHIETREVHYPADWVQHLKQRWLPHWLKRLFPVRETIVKFETKLLYPEIELPHNDKFGFRVAVLEEVK